MLNKSFSLTLYGIIALFSVATIFNTALMADNHNNNSKEKDIVETAIEAGKFKTLATALTEAGLVDALKGEGPFTVFAPTDEAFSKLPKGTLENLLKDKDALKKILLYHVVSGKVTSKDVSKIKSASTLEGSEINISVKKGTIKINKSKVTSADINAKNGIIHIIDTVLMPPVN